MKNYLQTDLACESFRESDRLPRGVEHRVQKIGGITVSRMRITEESAALAMGRACGSYVTYSGSRLNLLGRDDFEVLARLLSGELCGMAVRLCKKPIGSELSVCIVGLGNRELGADALGPEVVRRLTPTRHLAKEDSDFYNVSECSRLCAIAPGVMGQTGIEVLELMRGVVRSVSPDLVIAVDALAARDCHRLACTVQVSDTGICPGSGVGNHRSELSQSTLGVPVISLGIPTVVHSATLVWDALEEAGIKEIDESLKDVLENRRSFFVTPKDCDRVTEIGSKLLARAVSLGFAEALTEEL